MLGFQGLPAVLARADFSYADWIRRNIKNASPDRVLVSKGDFVISGGEKGGPLHPVVRRLPIHPHQTPGTRRFVSAIYSL